MLLLLHGDGPVAGRDWWTTWHAEPAVLAGLVVVACWYALGVRRLRESAGPGRGLAVRAPWWFGAGLATVALALCSPLDALSDQLFAAHMAQHLLLMLVAAPLIALGAPSVPMLWAFRPARRRAIGGWWQRSMLARVGGLVTRPVVAWALSVGALVFWHVPGPFRAALGNETIHALEHLSFLVTGVLFWWIVLRPDGYRRLNPGLGVLYVFTAMLPGGLLGALLTFAGRPLYGGQSAGAALWGLTPLGDQQLAGLIMWMPGGAVHLVAAATLFVLWLRETERRNVRAAGLTAALMLLALLVPSCKPASRPPSGGDTTEVAGPPEMAAESLPAGKAVAAGFTPAGAVVGLNHPESVRYDPVQDLYFVSNYTGTLTAKDDNGFISRVRPDGSIDSLKFIAGGQSGVTLNAPTGMALAGDTLWVADVTVVRAFNARTGTPVATVDLGPFGPRLLNDVTLGPDHAVYVTDTGIRFAGNGATEHPGPDRIFRIDPHGRPSVALGAGVVDGPNGITWDSAGHRFLVVSFTGKAIYAWSAGQRQAKTIAEGPGQFDGVVVLGDGRTLVSSWADSSVYELHGSSLTKVIAGVPQPADIGLDPKRHRLAIPVSSENRVEFWAVPGT